MDPEENLHTQRAVGSGQIGDALRVITAISDGLDRLTSNCAVALTLGFAAVMVVGVFFRYALNSSLSWADEVALILFGWSTMLFVTSAFLHDRHVKVDFLLLRLSDRGKRRAAVLADGLSGGYIIALFVASFQAYGLVSRSHTDALQFPMTLHFSAVPLSALIMLVHWARLTLSSAGVSGLAPRIGIAVVFLALVMLPVGNYIEISGPAKALLLGGALLVPMLIGVPVAIALGLLGVLYLAVMADIAFLVGSLQVFYGINTYALTAIPLLILSGKLLHSTGIAKFLVEFAQVLVGRLRGGLGASNVLASLLFGDISGSAVSDTAAVGSLMIPQMKRQGYRADFCAALQGAAGSLGMIAPLSITVLLYSAAANSSVSRLAAATLLPALLLAISFIAYVIWHARRYNYPKQRIPATELLPRTVRALPGLSSLLLIVVGILGGVFTPTETGSILLAYVLFLAVIFYKVRDLATLHGACVEAGHITGMTLFMVCASGLVGFVLARDLVSIGILDLVSSVSMNRYFVLFVLSVVFVVLGMVLEPPAMIFGFLPTFLPLLTQADIDLIHWGVLIAVNTALGCIVPPVALNLFVSTRLAGVTYGEAIRAAVPFMIVLAVDLAIIAALPQISLLLPHLIFGYPMN